jgi:hypothetical protein
MWMTISPAMATTIARQQTIDEVQESRRLKAARTSAQPASETSKPKHRARRHRRAFWSVHLHGHAAH